MDAYTYIHHVRFCPECGKALEINAIAGSPACFLHGDFVVSQDRIVWDFTKNLIKRPDPS